MNRTTRIAAYQEHLSSNEWEAIKAAANDRAGGRCEHCQAPVASFHHVRYPKQFKNDAAHNVLAVCKRCHDLHHGIREMKVQGELDHFVHDGIAVHRWIDNDIEHYSFAHVYAIAHKIGPGELKRPLHQQSMRQKWGGLPSEWCRLADYPQSNYAWLVGKEGVQGCLARFDTTEGNAFLVALVKKWNEPATTAMSIPDALIATGNALKDHEQRITALESRPVDVRALPEPMTCTVLVRQNHHGLSMTIGERAVIGRECRRIILRNGEDPNQYEHVAHGSEPGRSWPIPVVDEALRNKGFLR